MKHEDLLQSLKDCEPMDVIDLYIEAKTGKHSFAGEILPVSILEAIHEIKSYINRYNADDILKQVK